MAQVSAASAAAAAGVDDDEIGARIARLGLPATPNVIGKTSSLTNCPHQGRCYCNVYTTMLDRGPELPTIPDSPERDSIWRDERRSAITTPRGNVRSNTGSGNSGSLSNGVSKSVPAKKISLGQYATHKKATVNGAPPRDSKSPAHGEKRPIERITPDALSERKLDRRREDSDRRDDVRESRSERPDNPPKRRRTPSPPPPPPPPVKEPPPPPPPIEKPRPIAARPRPPSPPPPPPPPPAPAPPPAPKVTLPPMMSPTLPAILEEALAREKGTKEAAAKPLPPLSPTLPPVLEEALATLESPKASRTGSHATKREGSVDNSITLKPSKVASSTGDKGARKSATATAAGAKKSAASRVTASPTKPNPSPYLKVPGEPKKQQSLKKVATEVPVGRIKKREVSETPAKRASSPAVTAKSRSGGHDEPSEDDTSDTEPKLSRIVKLKFRQNKWRYENFVKLTKNPKDKVAESDKRPVSDVAGKSTGKRVRETEEREKTPIPKKAKTETSLAEVKIERERERDKMASRTNTPSKGSDLPPLPKKERGTTEKGAARRTESRNGETPQVKVKDNGRVSTPVPIKKEARGDGEPRTEGRARKVSSSQPPQQLDPAMNAKAEAFAKEHMRYQDFGKKSKHEAEGKIQSDRVAKDERYSKLLQLDSVLCYIVAFLCEEEANTIKGIKPNLDSWRSILPFLRVVLGKCKDIPPLYGLGKLLEAVILQHLLALDTDRFEKQPLPDAAPLTPETGVSLTPNPHASTGAGLQAREHFALLKSQLIRSIRETHGAWTEANQLLPFEELRRSKRTWEKRASKISSDRHRIRMPGYYKSEYSLPLHVNSSLLEAVNFGCSFLAEWSSETGLTLWESKVKLREPGNQR